VEEHQWHRSVSRRTVLSDDIESRDLVTRLRLANDRIRRLREDVDSADNVIRFRVERHVEAAEETVGDLNVRATDMPVPASYGRRLFERGLRGLEFEIVSAEAKLEAARAEEQDDARGFVRASGRAMSAQRSALRAETAGDLDDLTRDAGSADDSPSEPLTGGAGPGPAGSVDPGRRSSAEEDEATPSGNEGEDEGKGGAHMALSDMLSELAQRAREAEDRARSASTEAKDKVRQRADEASVSAHQKADELKQQSDAARQQASDRWGDVHKDWATHVDKVHAKFAEVKAKQDRAWSQMDADAAADDARAACSFALAAVEEAESATLDAILAQMEADDAASRT
jgi:hypothetical protein